MDVAELFLVLSVSVLPLVLGVLAALWRRPWWWAALGAVVVAMLAAIVPTPEAGQPRLATEDLLFLLLVALWVTGLAWLGFAVTRRFWVDRHRT